MGVRLTHLGVLGTEQTGLSCLEQWFVIGRGAPTPTESSLESQLCHKQKEERPGQLLRTCWWQRPHRGSKERS